jgi:hypothetical protein
VEFDPTPPGVFAADPSPEFVALLKDRTPLTLGPDVAGPRARTALRPITGVTYNGHPLDTYAADQAPGQTSGLGLDDFGAEWYALSAAATRSTTADPSAAAAGERPRRGQTGWE